jgi:16S rRNA processing protein RimM
MSADSTPAGSEAPVCLGVVVGARGLKGDVRIKSFTADPQDVAAYGPVATDDGQRLELKITGEAKGVVIARIAGISDRTAAEDLKGQRLYVARDALPQTEDEDEYYHADLIGMTVVDETDAECGTVIAIYDFGSGDVIDLRLTDGGTVMLPFTRAVVPKVDLSAGHLVVSRPALEAALADETPQDDEAEP